MIVREVWIVITKKFLFIFFFFAAEILTSIFWRLVCYEFFGLAPCPLWIYFLDLNFEKIHFYENTEAWINIWSVAKTTQVAWRFKQPTKKLEFLFSKIEVAWNPTREYFLWTLRLYILHIHQSLPIIYIMYLHNPVSIHFVCTTN